MPTSSSSRKIPPSLGPRRQRVCRADVMLVIEPLARAGTHRPLCVDLPQLEQFSALMAEQGWAAHVSRLAFDRIYASQRFAWAQQRGPEPLRQLAHGLMQALLR